MISPPLYLSIARVDGNGFSHVILEVFKATDIETQYPYLIRFTYGFSIVSFYLPITLEVKGESVPYTICEHIPRGRYVLVKTMKIEDNIRIKADDRTYTLKYKSKD